MTDSRITPAPSHAAPSHPAPAKMARSMLAGALIATCAGIAAPAQATTLFFDNFEGQATGTNAVSGWTFTGNDANEWNVGVGAGGNKLLQSESGQGAYDGLQGFGLINGVTASSHFSMEADIQAVGEVPNRTDPFGHIGFVWGYQDAGNFNNLYLRVHSNHVTHFSRTGGASSGEQFLVPGVSTASADAPSLGAAELYHLKLEVNHLTQMMTTTLTIGGIDYSQSFSGAAFSALNPHLGGQVGVQTWGERVAYDNVRYVDLTVASEPGMLALMLAGGFAGVAVRRRRG